MAVPAWEKMNWLWHGFSTRQGGVSRVYAAADAPGELNLGFTAADDRSAVEENRLRLAEAISQSRATPLQTARQIHSCLSQTIADRSTQTGPPIECDGFITATSGLLLAVQTADCIPVLVADRRLRVVACFHAGWRGTVKRIVDLGVARMRSEFGCQPQDLTAAIGPGAAPCCYIVGEELLEAFKSEFAYADELFPKQNHQDGALRLDLVQANQRQLIEAGLSHQAIHTTGGCTCCMNHLFFSHRASGGHAGRMMAAIGIGCHPHVTLKDG